MKPQAWASGAVIAAAVAAGWLLYARLTPPPAPIAQPAAPAAPAASAAQPAAAPAEAAPAPPAHPVSRVEIPAALEAFLGGKAMTTYVQLDDFARRLVATVDNLGRAHAPAAVWPLHPAAGRFTVDESSGSRVIAAENAARYAPLVLVAETIDAGQAADLYLRLYPVLQQEYRQLGFPDGQFNRRLMEVIALLLATPEPEQPPQLTLVEVKGPIVPQQPWLRYEYADPALEQLTAGQKILVRVGLVNERRLKKKLAEFREAVLQRTATR